MPSASRTNNTKQETGNRKQNSPYLKGFKFKVSSFKLKPAFTLIELLIIIALIGILSSFGVFSYQSSQKKARDGQRKSDLQQVKRALEAAKNDCLGGSYYPSNNSYNGLINYALFLLSYLPDPDLHYLNQTFNDPITNKSYFYHISTFTSSVCPGFDGTANTQYGVKTFVLRAQLEITNDQDSANSFAKCQIQSLIDTGTINFSAPNPSSGDGYYYVCPD